MTVQKDPRVQSEADLEVAFLYETHDLLAAIIGPEYYHLLGDEIRFHTSSRFHDFFVHVDELFARGREKLPITPQPKRLSLFDAGVWFIERHAQEAAESGFDTASSALSDWLSTTPVFRFWSGELGTHVEFPLSRSGMISYSANLHKHRLLRLGAVFGGLGQLLADNETPLSDHQVVAIRDSFAAELRNRLLYLSTSLVELLGKYFQGLNAIIVTRGRLAGTNDASLMPMPVGITSDVFRDLYASTLVFHSYPASRIFEYTPETPAHLKKYY